MALSSIYEKSESCLVVSDSLQSRGLCSCPWNSLGKKILSLFKKILSGKPQEWVAISFSRGSSQPRDRTRVSLIAGRCFTVWATREAESEEELKSLLMKMKEESEKVRLKHNIQKTKIMLSGPITSWEIEGETLETVTDFIVVGLQNHCRWWLQTWN